MTVFKGFLTIAKRNLGMMFLYILIFLTISLFIQNALSDSKPPVFRLNLCLLQSLIWTAENWQKE